MEPCCEISKNGTLLHPNNEAGDCFLCPFTKQLSYTGHHVNHAARIESITVEGEVYASLAFTALASEEHIADFHCEYAGLLPLAKNYGTFPVYHLRRRG